MSNRLRRALERRRKELAGKAAARLADEPNADVAQELARLAIVDRVLAALPIPRWRAALGPAAMLLVCVAAVGALWTVTIDALGGRTDVVLAVDADTVALDVAGDWDWEDRIRLADGRLRIERAELTFSVPGHAFDTLPDSAWLDVEADGVILQRFSLEPGTELTLEHEDSETLAMYIAGAASGGVLVDGSMTLTWGEMEGAAPQTRSFRVDVPEEITFSPKRGQGAPARMALQPAESLTLRELPVSRLRFGRESSSMTGKFAFVSTVRGGRLHVPDVSADYELAVGDSVIMSGLNGHIRQLRVENANAIAVDLEGTVERVAVGPQGRERDLTPSLLSYLYYNERLAFLFAAASFIWGILWSLRWLVGG